jgi:hypothetical protein
VVVHGSGHGGPAFTAAPSLELIDSFLREHLPEPSLAVRGKK